VAERSAPDRVAYRLPAGSTLAGLTLRARDLGALRAFYVEQLGLPAASEAPHRVTLAPAGGAFALELLADPGAPLRPRPSVGLYHFALLLPDRPSLAALIRRLAEARLGFDGASDHGVSEAFYLHDPEGNGIELYRDRPEEAWPRDGGEVKMFTERLDVPALLAEAPRAAPVHPAARLGHIHLQVDDLRAGERFYAEALGLTVTQRSYPGALFLAAGAYHHHVALNTWGGGRRAPAGATGLTRYGWRVPEGALDALVRHLRDRGAAFERAGGGVALTDPAGVRVEVRERAGEPAGAEVWP
jgi:catechol 2,3-dioxygenase